MGKRPIPWGWLILGFLGYGIVGFSLLLTGNFFTLPLGAELVLSLVVAALVALILTFAVPVGVGLLVLFAIGFSLITIICTAYFWQYVSYFWSSAAVQYGYLALLGICMGTVWTGVVGLIAARNELVKNRRKLPAFWILAGASTMGLAVGWLVGWLTVGV